MDLRSGLVDLLDDRRVLTRYVDRIAWANDASVYRRVPRAVVQPSSEDDIRALFRFSREHRVPLTFRTAGTSLSGQAITDGILVDVSTHWRRVEVLDAGRRVRVQPGVVGGHVNRLLAPHGTKLGPDPASINACMMGGILANNSSGMCCGVADNAYHTLESMRFVLPDGTTVDSADAGCHARFAREASEIHHGIARLKARVEGDAGLAERIRSKYRMKNTNGYSLNAFLDHDLPVDVLTHLMIGSEGTLGFISEAVLRAIPDGPFKYTGLLLFDDVPSACAAIGPLRESGARALELMDRASLRSIQDQPGVPSGLRDLPPRSAALLAEYQCESESELGECVGRCRAVLARLPLRGDPGFSRDAARRDALWRVRKGLIPSVGAMRRRGTSFIIEDVVFPVESLAEGVAELQGLFAEHGYDDAIVFGHAKDGNLHFVLTQAFQDPRDVDRYDAFMRDLAGLVAVRHGGALKAEHGTGRNMAPFVETEWGPEAYAVMKELKSLLDPDRLLNPGVILNDDPRAHLGDLKSLPAVESEVDGCIECGFCEPVCPSRDLTLTPRRRIVVRREMARLRDREPGSSALRELEADWTWMGLDTCAVDGLCATACPVGIDTGRLVKRLRAEARSELAHEIAAAAADRFALIERTARIGLRALRWGRRIAGRKASAALLRTSARALGDRTGEGLDDLPRAASGRLPVSRRSAARAVYLPSCVSRVLAPAPGNRPLADTIVEVARRAGVPVWIPEDVAGHCCGMAFSSKGWSRAYRRAVRRTVASLWTWTDAGAIPVVLDSSPCALTLKQAGADLDPPWRSRLERLRVLDGIEFARDLVVPGLATGKREGRVVVHPVCSVVKMNLAGALVDVLSRVAEEVTVPTTAGCCGFAGDRGFSVPLLTASATRAEAAEINAQLWDGFYSSSRTCEIGLSRATGRPFRSFWYGLESASRARSR